MNLGFYLTLMIGPNKPVAAPLSVMESLASVQVTTSSGQRSGFQLTFTMGRRSPLNVDLLPNGYFDPQNRVIISVIVNGVVSVLMDGVITQQQLVPSNEPGQSTLTITGEDLTRMMDIKDRTGNGDFNSQDAQAQVRTLLQRADYDSFGLDLNLSNTVVNDEPDPKTIRPQQRGTDLAHINRLAEMSGYVFYLQPGPVPKKNVAYWGPEKKTGNPQPALTVNMDAHTNVESLNFSYDGFAKAEYKVEVLKKGSKDPHKLPTLSADPLNPPLGTKIPPALRKEKIQLPGNYSDGAAQLYAMALASRSDDVITANGQLDVMRYGQVLKARQLAGVRGAGVAYDGLYYVRSVTHNIKAGEYKQSFTLSRNALISSSQNLPV